MFSNLKKKIESEVGDLSRLTPSSVLNRTSNSSTLSSRHASVSSLASEPSPQQQQQHVDNLLSPGGGGAASPTFPVLTPTSTRTVHHQQQQQQSSSSSSLNALKIKQLEERLQSQESDFAWRLSTKDDEILKLSKTVDILTAELRDKEQEVRKRLCRVQEDIDEQQGFSQQENAKLKHLLLNKEEELGRLRGEVLLKDQEVERLNGKVKELEVDNERVRVGFEKLTTSGSFSSSTQELEKVIENLNRELDVSRKRSEEQTGVVAQLQAELDSLKSEMADSIEKLRSSNASEIEGREKRIGALRSELEEKNKTVQHLTQELELMRKNDDDDDDHELEDLKTKLGASVEQLKQKSDALEARARDLETANSKLKAYEKELENLKLNLKKQQQQHDGELKSKVEGLESELASALEQLKTKSNELDANKKELESVAVQLEKSKAEAVQGLEKEKLEQVNQLLELKQEELESLRRTVQDQEAELAKRKAEVEDLQKKLEESESKANETLRSQQHQAEQTTKELKQQMAKLKQHRDSLSDKLEVLVNENRIDKGRVDELGKLNQELQKKLEEERESLTKEFESKHTRTNEKLKELEGLVRRYQGQLTVITNERDELSSTVSELRLNEQMRKTLASSDDSEVEQLKSKCSWLEQENERLEESVETLTVELETTKRNSAEEIESLNKRLKAYSEYRKEACETAKLAEDKIIELSAKAEEYRVWGETLEQQNGELRGKLDDAEREVGSVKKSLEEVEGEKEDMLLSVSEMQEKIDELEEECRFLRGGKERVKELEGVVAEKEKQLRQQSQALSDLRRSLAKELSSKEKHQQQQHIVEVVAPPPQQQQQVPPHEALYSNGMVNNGSGGKNNSSSDGSAATLPQYETDVNFMYLRSVLFKYLTSQDPQITSHLTRVVATLLHLTEEETNVLITTTESRNSHLLSIIK